MNLIHACMHSRMQTYRKTAESSGETEELLRLTELPLLINMTCSTFSNLLGNLTLPAIEVGRVCVKTSGREAGHKCVVVELIDKNFALVTGPKEVTGVKRRRVNISHVEPTVDKINVDRGATDEDVAKALEAAGKTEEMRQAVKPIA